MHTVAVLGQTEPPRAPLRAAGLSVGGAYRKAPRPAPEIGDWIVTAIPTCRFWSGPLSKPQFNHTIAGAPRKRGVYLGPVHAFDHTEQRTAVLISHPSTGQILVWINIWSLRTKGGNATGVAFAHLVPRAQRQDWEAAGWVNRF